MSDEIESDPQPRPRGEHVLSLKEMELQERSQEMFVRSWVDAFLRFPTPNNRQGLIDRLADYQASWMHGRERPADLQKS